MAAALPDEEQMRTWLQQWGEVFHFRHTVPRKGGAFDELFIFRRLSRREYRAVLMGEDVAQREEDIVEECVLWPLDWTVNPDDPAGVVTTLCAQILKASGCGEHLSERFQEMANFVASDLEAQMETVIDHVFGGGGNFARYKDWSHAQLFDAYYRAQWMLGVRKNDGVPETVKLNGKEVDLAKLTPRQRQQAMAQLRIEQTRSAQNAPAGEKLSVSNEDGESISLDSAIDAYSGGSAALSNMSDFMKKNQKYKAQQAIRKLSSARPE